MSRPRKGEKGCEEASNKWRRTMLKKYGGKEGLHKRAQELGSLGGKAPTSKPKGFAANPEIARIAGYRGGRISRRGPAKDDIDKIEEELEKEHGRD